VRRSLYQSDDQLAVSDKAVSLDLISLYKALGGGWETLAQQPAKKLSTAALP
jgi:outer membrane protein, multidrug efflux system